MSILVILLILLLTTGLILMLIGKTRLVFDIMLFICLVILLAGVTLS